MRLLIHADTKVKHVIERGPMRQTIIERKVWCQWHHKNLNHACLYAKAIRAVFV